MTSSTIIKTNNTLPREILSIAIEYAYGMDLDTLNFYIQQVLLKARFAPIPLQWSRIFSGRKIQWFAVLDGDFHLCIHKFFCFRQMMQFVEDVNWNALKHSSLRTLESFAKNNKKYDVLRGLQTKKTRELTMWRLFKILPCFERRDMKKKSWWRIYRLGILNFDTNFPLASYIDPPKVFITS